MMERAEVPVRRNLAVPGSRRATTRVPPPPMPKAACLRH